MAFVAFGQIINIVLIQCDFDTLTPLSYYFLLHWRCVFLFICIHSAIARCFRLIFLFGYTYIALDYNEYLVVTLLFLKVKYCDSCGLYCTVCFPACCCFVLICHVSFEQVVTGSLREGFSRLFRQDFFFKDCCLFLITHFKLICLQYEFNLCPYFSLCFTFLILET